MGEKSGVHLTGVDSGWPTAAAVEPPFRKLGDGVDGLPHARAVNDGVVTADEEGVYITLFGGDVGTEWNLTLSGQTTSDLALDTSAAELLAAMVALSNVAPADLTVVGNDGGPYTLRFLEAGAWGDVVPVITADAVGANEVQLLTIDADDGEFTLAFLDEDGDLEVTAVIDFAAGALTAATIEAALEALDAIAPADVAVTGDPGGPYTITFAAALAEANIAALVPDDEDLTGGAGTAVITDVTPGLTGPVVTVAVVAEGS
jgi:hypothetical protein